MLVSSMQTPVEQHPITTIRIARRSLSLDLHLDKADLLEVETIACVFGRKYRFHDASGHHDLTGFQPFAARSQLRGEPCDRIEGMAEDVAAVSFTDRNTVFRSTP